VSDTTGDANSNGAWYKKSKVLSNKFSVLNKKQYQKLQLPALQPFDPSTNSG
jgi:hypothetical protein